MPLNQENKISEMEKKMMNIFPKTSIGLYFNLQLEQQSKNISN